MLCDNASQNAGDDGGGVAEEPNRGDSYVRLLEAVERMSPAELDRFAADVLSLRARRIAHVLTPDESVLFERINDAFPQQERERLASLRCRGDDETLSEAEYRELIDLEDRLELLNANRLGALTQLAALRGATLAVVMNQLGIGPPGRGSARPSPT